VHLPDYQLFIGVPIDQYKEKRLHEVADEVYKAFISDSEQYLAHVTIDGQAYIGKCVGDNATVEALILLRTHIASILLKLCPAINIRMDEFQIIPFESSSLTIA